MFEQLPARKFKKLDIGDIIGVSRRCLKPIWGNFGEGFAVYAAVPIAQAATQFHGLRHRHPLPPRYLDLIVNPEVKRPLCCAAISPASGVSG